MTNAVRVLRDKLVVEPAKAVIQDCKQAIPAIDDDQTFFHVVYAAKPAISMYEWAKSIRPLLVDKRAWPNFDSMQLARADLTRFNSKSDLGFEIAALPVPWETLDGKVSRAYFLNVALDDKAREALEMVERLERIWSVGLGRKKTRLKKILANKNARVDASRLDAQIKRAIARGKR